MTSVQAFAALEAHKPLQPFTFDLPPIDDDQVDIKVTHCGVCYGDVGFADNESHMTKYPFVPGHEVIGTVSAVGPRVQHLKVGDRVGLGWLSGSCSSCSLCRTAQEAYCSSKEQTIIARHGGFASHVRAHEHFALRIPDALSSEVAGPLMCGGSTVYVPLRKYAHPWSRVGVLGIGGLGHLALQIARAFGCQVVAFSSSADKEAEALKFGATRFVNTSDKAQVEAARGSVDLLINTASGKVDVNQLLGWLDVGGVLAFVGFTGEKLDFSSPLLMLGNKTITGNLIGGPTVTKELLEFAAVHNIAPQIELLPMSEVNAAMDKVRANKARYRMVLHN